MSLGRQGIVQSQVFISLHITAKIKLHTRHDHLRQNARNPRVHGVA